MVGEGHKKALCFRGFFFNVKEQFCDPDSFKCTYLSPKKALPRRTLDRMGSRSPVGATLERGASQGWRGVRVQLCCPPALPPRAGHSSSLGFVSPARKRRGWPKWSRSPAPRLAQARNSEDRAALQEPALPRPGKGREAETSQVSAVFLEDRSFRESLASTFFFPF